MSTIKSHRHDHHQSLKLLLIAAFLVVTPLLSSSLRSKYLYFIVNLLIIAVGAEAGLLSFFNKKPLLSDVSVHVIKENTVDDDHQSDKGSNPVKAHVEKKGSLPKPEKLSHLPNPTIFFIGGGESENHITSARAEESIMEDDDNDGDEELFEKAEMFIGNFYKQLKMQRDESRNKLHHLVN